MKKECDACIFIDRPFGQKETTLGNYSIMLSPVSAANLGRFTILGPDNHEVIINMSMLFLQIIHSLKAFPGCKILYFQHFLINSVIRLMLDDKSINFLTYFENKKEKYKIKIDVEHFPGGTLTPKYSDEGIDSIRVFDESVNLFGTNISESLLFFPEFIEDMEKHLLKPNKNMSAESKRALRSLLKNKLV
jgi:hypothetical protein